MKLPFVLEVYDDGDKYLYIDGPKDLLIQIYYDDVDHDLVDAQVEKILNILNTYWE